MDDAIKTVAAPELPKSVQLNEDAELRVLAGTSSYISEAKKKEAEKKEEVKETDEMKVGDKKKSSTGGTIEKTKTGIKHTSGKNYSGKEAEKEEKAKKESINPEVFKSKFLKMVEAKKAKPDFLDMDKDGNKKEPMKKAVADKKKGAVKETDEMKVGDKKKSSTGGTIEKTKTGLKHTSGKNYSGKEAEKEEKSKKTDEAKMPTKQKKTVKESVESKLSFKEMIKLVQESGGQQQIDPIDTELFAWAQRVASSKFTESAKAEIYAGLIYERNGGVFEMYDVLSENQK